MQINFQATSVTVLFYVCQTRVIGLWWVVFQNGDKSETFLSIYMQY